MAQYSAELYQQAEQGYAEVQHNLGWAYVDGNGVDKNTVAGVKWFRKAAEQGHALAQYNLGLAYFFGAGVAEDRREAYIW